MLQNSERHHRRSIRLPGYDYRQAGAYFVTLCAYGRECLFGDIVDGSVVLSAFGAIAEEEWLRSAEIRKEMALDAFVVMPNHLHGVVWIRGEEVAATAGRTSRQSAGGNGKPEGLHGLRSLGAFVSGFKAATTRRINLERAAPGTPVWQRNYYEHVIRKDDSLESIRRYIVENPARWSEDRENPAFSDRSGETTATTRQAQEPATGGDLPTVER